MQFVGRGDELRPRLAHFLVGDARLDDASQYVPGATCGTEDTDVSFEVQRINCAQRMIIGHFYRARCSGVMEIGSANDVVGTPIEVNALDDVNGNFGGSQDRPTGTSASPTPASNARGPAEQPTPDGGFHHLDLPRLPPDRGRSILRRS